MRRITLWMIGTVAVLVLLFSYRTSTGASAVVATTPRQAEAPGVVSAPAPSVQPSTQPSTHSSTSAKAKQTPSATSTTAKSQTVNGTVAQTRWGPVQVQVHIAGDRITDVTALIYPSGNGRDGQINAYALPQLRQEVLSAQSARIDSISGATVTSGGYIESLQAALDAAHFNG